MSEVVVVSPEPGREYGAVEAIGPFTDGFAQDYLDNHMEVEDGWQAEVVSLTNPSEER